MSRPQVACHAPLVDRMLALQATIGNRAVARIATTPAAVAVRGRRVQRKRVLARATGLRMRKNVTAFAHQAEAYWYDPANKNKPLKDYAEHLMATVNGMLKNLGAVECNHSYDAAANDSGAFSRTTWNIEINPGKFSKDENVSKSKVGELTVDEARDVADTIFHESRHSEQFFRIARLQAGRLGPNVTAEKAAKKISAEMAIPLNVASAAVSRPLTAGATLSTEASDWESITVGRHRQYKNNVNWWMAEVKAAKITSLAEPNVDLDAKKAGLDAAIARWKKGNRYVKFAESHLAKTEKIKAPSTVDQRVITNLTKIKAAFRALDKAAKEAGKNWKTKAAQTKVLKLLALETQREALSQALYDAYREHIHEEDAWATGAAVQAAFKTKYEADEKAKAAAERKAKAKAKKKPKTKAKTATTSAIDGQPSVTADPSPPTQPDPAPPTRADREAEIAAIRRRREQQILALALEAPVSVSTRPDPSPPTQDLSAPTQPEPTQPEASPPTQRDPDAEIAAFYAAMAAAQSVSDWMDANPDSDYPT